MAKVLLSVGFEVPGGEVEEISLLSDRSLLDADIILFQPGIPDIHGSSTYLGKTCLSDDGSFRVREAISHWKRELGAAVDAGKLVVVLLDTPEVVYVATGEKTWSGSGRNARSTRIVEQLHAYSALPTKWSYHPATGTEMIPVSEARFFAPYWSEFSRYCQYRLYLEAEGAKPLVHTKSGSRSVGAFITNGRGALLAIPALNVEDENFVEANDKDEYIWNKNATRFGKKLVTALIAMADSLASETALSPQPDWARDDKFRLPAEEALEVAISKITSELVELGMV